MMNFRQIMDGIDVHPLLEQLAAIPTARRDEECYPYFGPVKWRKVTEWTHSKGRDVAIYHEANIVWRFATARIGENGNHTPVVYDSTHPPGSLSAVWPIVCAVNDAAGGDIEKLGHVIITRLPKGGRIGKHIDHAPPVPGLPYWQRHQVPLAVSPGVVFGCGGEELYMKPGHAYWFDNQKEHWVHNGSGRDRLTMIVELRIA